MEERGKRKTVQKRARAKEEKKRSELRKNPILSLECTYLCVGIITDSKLHKVHEPCTYDNLISMKQQLVLCIATFLCAQSWHFLVEMRELAEGQGSCNAIDLV